MAVIGVCGSNYVGKTTFVNDFIKKWPEYKVLKESIVGSTKPTLKKDFEKTEKFELDIMIEQLKGFDRKKDKIIIDGCIIDNLIRVLWNKDKNSKINDNFVWKIVMQVKNNMSRYDAIFYIPLMDKYPIEIKDKKINLNKRKEMSNLYEAIIETYKKHAGSYFPLDECGAILETFGSPKERIVIADLYMEEINKLV